MKRLVLACLCLALAPWLPARGPAAARAVVQPREIAQPCDDCIPGVGNFAKISAALWRGDQPTAEGFKNLEMAGARTIVSFRHDHDDLPLMKGTRLKYLRIPSRAFHPTYEHLAVFLKVLADPANWPVFIHCAEGRDRTGYNAAAYRMVVQGWDAESALREMDAFRFNRVWVLNPRFIRKLDVAKLKRMAQESGEPAFQKAAP